MGSLLNIMTDFFKASTRSLKKFHHKMIYANLMVDPWLTEKRVDRKKMTVDRIFFSKNNTFCME